MDILITILSWIFGIIGIVIGWFFIGYVISLCVHIIEEKEFLLGHLVHSSVVDEHIMAGPLLLVGLVGVLVTEYIKDNKNRVIWRSKTKCAEKALFGDKE